MPPERLITLLAQLVADGELSEEEAATILLHWREIEGLEMILPLPTAAGIATEPRDDERLAALLAAAVGYLLLSGTLDVQAGEARLRSIGAHARIGSANRLQDLHAAEARRLAKELAAGRISVAEWQRRMRALNALHLDAMLILGTSRWGPSLPAALAAALPARRRQKEIDGAAYLQRFAEQAAGNLLAAAAAAAGLAVGGRLAGGRWSADRIGQRAAMYSGAGRALFFEAWETSAGYEAGWVVRYEAVDDAMTCTPCGRAEGYYLPGRGPMPGDVCLGGGACRCARWPVFDPAIYRQLTGQAV